MKTSIHIPGTRVRVRRGRFPMDPALIGRSGMILEMDVYEPGHYGVTLDGEPEVREFTEDELEPLGRGKTLEQMGDAGPGIGPKNA